MDKRPHRSIPSYSVNIQQNNNRVGDGVNAKNSLNGMINLNLIQTPLTSTVNQKVSKRNKVTSYSLKTSGHKPKLNGVICNNISSIGYFPTKIPVNSTNAISAPDPNLNPNSPNIAQMSTLQKPTTVSPVNLKSTTMNSIRIKNEEAVNDLRQRIPEIEKIFDVHTRIGNGTFSTVLLGTLKKERHMQEDMRRKFAIKHHIPTSHPERIMRELQCMANIGGVDNVVGINCCMRCNESVAFIMPYMPHDRFHDFFNKMDLSEVQFYMKNLLVALRRVHRYNIIHRDVKPSNFLYNRNKRQFLLVDFGLAQQAPVAQSQSELSGVSQKLSRASGIGGATAGVTGEGNKRAREQDDGDDREGIKSCLDTFTESAKSNTVVSGVSKRLRCTGPNGDQQVPASGAVAKSENAMTFKMPLKQLNEITTPIGSKASTVAATVNNSNNNNINNNNNNLGNSITQMSGTVMIGGSNDTSSKYNTNRSLTAMSAYKCFCYGNAQVCNICLIKKEIHASRAGTPGYRPPEVLLKYADQTTAVDIWAAGVIFLSILSSVYPFFKAPNDFIALAEMITIFGDKSIRNTACILDRLITLSQHSKPLDLRKLCVRFRNRAKFSSLELLKKYQKPDGSCEVCKNCDQYYFNCLCAESSYKTEPLDSDDVFPSSAYDLLYRLLEVNPHKRITAEQALQHEFFNELDKNACNQQQTSKASLAATQSTFSARK